ncbi:OsmC family protein [Flavobacterium orientale]|uniref:Stress-induced protein OsmC n=1 Tax=Flavobacterium orientale TaxID=1756020 RepID=A0A917DBI2_9FLAO|nr:OsmC family protein [Flavobacterium orientale]GGD25904.1 stress-induced protein OsmC [Flavobacterium orientale]
MTSRVIYNGELRTTSIHLQSGTQILSDAPKDNHGKGEAFSPTDLVANSLATCMFSIMGIKARDLEIDLSESTAIVTKIMQSEPRKIARIEIIFEMAIAADEKTKTVLERAALTCPVYLSLHPDIEKIITFHWK